MAGLLVVMASGFALRLWQTRGEAVDWEPPRFSTWPLRLRRDPYRVWLIVCMVATLGSAVLLLTGLA
jgi:uncharacterized membrane protein YphA (DoxX/SURF4 family)